MNLSPLSGRPAVPTDYDAFVPLFRTLGTPDPVPPAARWETEMMPWTLVFSGGADTAVVAYTFLQPMAATGYVRQVAIAPSHRGKGFGRGIMSAAAGWLRARGCSSWCLNVRPDNLPAVRLYTRCGLSVRYHSHALRMTWDAVATLPREAVGPVGRIVNPADDPAVERAFGLPAGQVATLRVRAGRIPLGLWEAEQCVGYASFDAGFPGAFPFRVARVELARWLLDTMREHASPGYDYVKVVVEDHDALASVLSTHGATAEMALVHMDGPIPVVV